VSHRGSEKIDDNGREKKRGRGGVTAFLEGGQRILTLAPEKVAPQGCMSLLSCSSCCCCSCCCWPAQKGLPPLKVASNSRVDDGGDAYTVPSSHVPLSSPVIPSPVAAAAAAASVEPPSGVNGHSQVPTVKLPRKSNLKQSSSFLSHAENGVRVSRAEDHVSNSEAGEVSGVDGAVDESGEKRECKVQWIDNFGKDLIQVHEFEPR